MRDIIEATRGVFSILRGRVVAETGAACAGCHNVADAVAVRGIVVQIAGANHGDPVRPVAVGAIAGGIVYAQETSIPKNEKWEALLSQLAQEPPLVAHSRVADQRDHTRPPVADRKARRAHERLLQLCSPARREPCDKAIRR